MLRLFKRREVHGRTVEKTRSVQDKTRKLSYRLEEESEDGSNACEYSGSVESVGCTGVGDR